MAIASVFDPFQNFIPNLEPLFDLRQTPQKTIGFRLWVAREQDAFGDLPPGFNGFRLMNLRKQT